MINGKRIAVVMPAYNAKRPGEDGSGTVRCGGHQDSCRRLSKDQTRSSGSSASRPSSTTNYGYGAISKPAIAKLSPRAPTSWCGPRSYQYTPFASTSDAGMISSGVYDMVLGSRILGNGALKGGCRYTNSSSTACLRRFQKSVFGRQAFRYTPAFALLA